MLQVEAPFPHAGCTAYFRGSAEPRRIIARNADGTCTVEVLAKPHMTVGERFAFARRGASLTRHDPLADLFATPEEASAVSRHRPRRPSAPRTRKARRG